jgi:geranylgeranyl diphosphate synthase, type II
MDKSTKKGKPAVSAKLFFYHHLSLCISFVANIPMLSSFNPQAVLQRINGEILLLEFGEHPVELYEPLHYIMSLGGKRLRPMLTLLACHLYSDDFEKAMKPALAIEVFHNFSLIHDDIMDQAPVRRGQPTVHTKWDTPTAILSGDVALVEAYKLLIQVDESVRMKAFDLFSKTAKEVCEGQQLDMLFEKREQVGLTDYMEMIRLKTAVLLGFSLQIGSLIGGASEEEAEKLRLFGEGIGLAFQVKDDYLDAYGHSEKVGKTIGGDIMANKKTFLFAKAMEIADTDTAEQLQTLYTDKTNPKTKVAKVMEIYQGLEIEKETVIKIESLYHNAMKQLVGLSPGTYKMATLKRLADSLIERNS